MKRSERAPQKLAPILRELGFRIKEVYAPTSDRLRPRPVTQSYPHSLYRIPEAALTNPALLQAVQELQDSPVSLVKKTRSIPS